MSETMIVEPPWPDSLRQSLRDEAAQDPRPEGGLAQAGDEPVRISRQLAHVAKRFEDHVMAEFEQNMVTHFSWENDGRWDGRRRHLNEPRARRCRTQDHRHLGRIRQGGLYGQRLACRVFNPKPGAKPGRAQRISARRAPPAASSSGTTNTCTAKLREPW
jgi:hypothetical protein